MKESADSHLDHLSRKVMGKSTTESPSFDFTTTLMSQINTLKTSKVTTYVPLISKRVWALILMGVIAIFGFAIFGSPAENQSWLSDLSLDRISGLELPNLMPNFNMSQTLIYAVVLFGLMFCIQIPILKRYFDKRLDA